MGRIAKASAPAGPRPHLRSLDIEAAQLFVAPGDSAMVWVGGHETARGALRIEQRACVAIADQPVFQRREIGEIAGKASI